MNSIVEEKVMGYLRTRLGRRPDECRAILFNIRKLAHAAGYEVSEAFGQAGLAAGPEASVASGIVMHALGGGGGGVVSEHMMKQTIRQWIRMTPRKSM